MRKILTAIICMVMAFSLVSCASTAGDNGHLDGSLADIFKQIYAGSGVENPILAETVLDDSNKVYMLGTDKVDFTEGLAS